jgi:hypothetical protein
MTFIAPRFSAQFIGKYLFDKLLTMSDFRHQRAKSIIENTSSLQVHFYNFIDDFFPRKISVSLRYHHGNVGLTWHAIHHPLGILSWMAFFHSCKDLVTKMTAERNKLRLKEHAIYSYKHI